MEEDIFITPSYFHLIYDHLSTVDKYFPMEHHVVEQLQSLKRDFRFLQTFCFCLETWWNSTTCYDDEEIVGLLRAIFTSLKAIWPKELQELSLLKRLIESRPINIQVFQSAKFELEAKIHQTKQKILGLCENLLHSFMQCKSRVPSSGYGRIWYILQHLHENLDDFSRYRATQVVKLKSQILFLEETLNACKGCPYGLDNGAVQRFLLFISDFINNAVCLTCLYWAKENNEEIAIEMNTALFDMLRKFIPFAPDITILYIGILKSYNLFPSDSFRIEKGVERLVDFFFEHLATMLKDDDFAILRDRLVFLFSFLTDPPCENTSEEDIIRSQIYALFRENNAYLILPFDVIKEDFSTEKILLSELMIKIDIETAKIRQLYSGFSDSWISLEIEKMEESHFVSIHNEVLLIGKHAEWADNRVRHQVRLYKRELRFIRMFLLCFATWDDRNEEIRERLSAMITFLRGIWEKEEDEKGLLATRLHALRTREFTDWHPFRFNFERGNGSECIEDWRRLSAELEGKIQLSKLEIEAWWMDSFHWSFQCKPSTRYKIRKSLDTILERLNDLVSYKARKIVPFKNQIETLKDKVVFLNNLFRLATYRISSKEFADFKMLVQVWASNASCLIYLYWAKDANDEIASETNSMLSHMMRKIKPDTPDVARLYFGTFKAIYNVRRSDSIIFGQAVLCFFDVFLEDLLTSLKDDFQILRDNIIFLLTFLNDPPNEIAVESICSKIDGLFWEDACSLVPFDDMGGDFSTKKVVLSEFMMTIEIVNASIRNSYCKFPDSSRYEFPKIISPGFLDFLIQNLRNLQEMMISDRKYAPFAKYKMKKIEEALVSLCPLFNHFFELQSEFNETWLEVLHSLHLTEHVINSCVSSCFVFDYPIWYHMSRLSQVLDIILLIQTKLDKLKEKNTMYDARCLRHSTSEQATPLVISELVVGFEDEEKKIIGKLTRGHMSLDIVSIVGMGGLGKTTIAKKVYGLVKCDFDVLAFCSVSQDLNTRRLLLDILSDINKVDEETYEMTDDDLAHKLWKCLSRQKYLIVLDDIWDALVILTASHWNKVKNSFPDDKNGSRVMFTTRSYQVADKCKIYSSPHELRFLSDVESWELLQKKVFLDGVSPPELREIGMLIAKNCKGLPLAAVVIAGLLGRTPKSVKWWCEVAERVVSYLSDEGCMKILELSYNHLPEYLKPCLLYLGAFPEDMLIKVKHVILLWVAEGFVQESTAKTYFLDLVQRSLIIVSTRSSDGEIKAFRVHDLIRELCQTKCQQGNFFQVNHGTTSRSIHKHNYRVSTQKQRDVNIAADSLLSNARSVFYFCEPNGHRKSDFPIIDFRHAHVLDLDLVLLDHDIQQLSSSVHLRHIHATVEKSEYIPSSIANLWNIQSFMLDALPGFGKVHLPETFWRMKSLRHVKVDECTFKFSSLDEHDGYPILDKVVSFSLPILSSGKDVQRLLQRIPSVKKLKCILQKCEYVEETLDFYPELVSLMVAQIGEKVPYDGTWAFPARY